MDQKEWLCLAGVDLVGDYVVGVVGGGGYSIDKRYYSGLHCRNKMAVVVVEGILICVYRAFQRASCLPWFGKYKQ